MNESSRSTSRRTLPSPSETLSAPTAASPVHAAKAGTVKDSPSASLPSRADVVIVGCGTAGAAAALLCARRGLEVVALDRAPLAHAGAHWINAVPERLFDEVALFRAPLLLGGSKSLPAFGGRSPRRLRDALALHGPRLPAFELWYPRR